MFILWSSYDLLKIIICIFCLEKVVADYCEFSTCEADEYCCGDNQCCKNFPGVWYLWFIGILILIVLFVLCIFAKFRRYSKPANPYNPIPTKEPDNEANIN